MTTTARPARPFPSLAWTRPARSPEEIRAAQLAHLRAVAALFRASRGVA